MRPFVDPFGFSPDETFGLERLEASVVTHQHADHIDTARGAQSRTGNPAAVLIADPEALAICAGPVDVLGVPSAPMGKVSETIEFVPRVAPKAIFPVHDCTIAEIAYSGGVEVGRKLGQGDSTTVIA